MGLHCEYGNQISCRLLTEKQIEPVRFQVNFLLDAVILRHHLHISGHLGRLLRGRFIHGRKFAVFQPLVRSGAAGDTL